MVLVLQADVYRVVVARVQSVVDGGVAADPPDLDALLADEQVAATAWTNEVTALATARASLATMLTTLADMRTQEAFSSGTEWTDVRYVVATTVPYCWQWQWHRAEDLPGWLVCVDVTG